MDHHGLLALTRNISIALQETHAQRQGSPDWSWAVTPVVYPESHCPYCKGVIRSPGIWCLRVNEGTWQLVGAFFPQAGSKAELVFPSHPHDTGGGYLCIGRNRDGVALLASTPNIDDAPMGRVRIPKWLKQYWNHACPEGLAFLQSHIDYKSFLEEYMKL